MRSLPKFLDQFDHKVPAAVFLLGIGFWALATLWSIIGLIVSQLTTLTFQTVALLAALLGALGTGLVVIGFSWYGILLAHDLYTELQT